MEQENQKVRPLVKETISVTLIFTDIIAMSLSFILALFTAEFLKDTLQPNIYNKPFSDYTNIHDLFFIWMCPIILLTFFQKGHYTQRVPWWSQVHNVLKICIIAFIIDGFTRFAFDMSFSRLLIGLSWIYVFFLTLAGRQIIYLIARRKGLWRIPTIVIGDVETLTDVLHAFSTDHYTGYKVETVCVRDNKKSTLDLETVPKKYDSINIETNVTDYKTYIQNNIDHFFVIALENFRGQERDNIIQTLTQKKALYAIVPPVSRVSLFEMEPRYFFGYDIMLLHAKYPILSIKGRFMKRSTDIALAVTALLLLSPIMLIAGIMLKAEGQGGSIFYGGYRIGKNGKKFKCWKFRSMEPDSDHLLHELLKNDPQANADWEAYRKLKQPDPRVTTKTARIIRKTSIDELPQLWNVIRGDMSLVGPRPILENEFDLFGDSIQEYLRVRPGITGLWQVSGRNDTTFERRIYWDGWYVRNWSFWGDIVIMIKTLRVVLGGSGAY
ncbi:MAG: exopolysaccharide biosynthesis polyprenyl glycosylphosphotransferase [Alphaproteobacteria bacterium]